MSYHTTPPPAEIRAARARRARVWAWPVGVALVTCVGVAIWQEPQLAPRVHARMQEAVAFVSTFEATDRVRGLIARMSGGSSPGDDAGLSGRIVEALKP
ncbi:MAG: hypothetical protein U5K36_03670 [Roseovarius sp.]|nr:hypothetical protein [Roseovarius sp.]